jgi:hypothetical protein
MPFCPSCHKEYRDPAETCPTCQTKLVRSLPQDPEIDPEGTTLVELATFSDVPEAEMVREILEQNQIPTVQRGEVDPIGVASGAEPIALLVEKRDLERARELHDAYFAGSDIEEPEPGQA